MQYSLHAVKLSNTISQRTDMTGYGRFRPNKNGSHSGRWCYRGGWHQSFPSLIRQGVYSWQKLTPKCEHSGFPYRTCVHRKGFPPAAPRRARVLISVPFSGLPLSGPVLIVALVSHYLTNKLISRCPILGHEFQGRNIPVSIPYQVLASVSRGYP